MTTSFLCSTMRRAFSMTISATWTWRSGGSSKVEAMTSAGLHERSMSVTSSGRSSISRMMRYASGLFLIRALASFWSSTVLPVRGGATMTPRVPLPMGQTRSSTRVDNSVASVSRMKRLFGKSGVRLSKCVFSLALSGSMSLTDSTLSRAKNFSFSFGGRIWPATRSPV